jgi:hypothetical protein
MTGELIQRTHHTKAVVVVAAVRLVPVAIRRTTELRDIGHRPIVIARRHHRQYAG